MQALLVDREGNAWVASGRGVTKIVRYGLETWTDDHGLFEPEVTAFHRRADGTAVVGHHGHLTLLRPDELDAPRTIVDLGGADDVKSRVFEIAEDAEGTLWVAANRLGLVSVKDGVVRKHGLPTDSAWVWSVVLDPAGAIWVGGQSGVATFRDGAFEPVDLVPALRAAGFSLDPPAVRRLALDTDGAVLAAVIYGGWCASWTARSRRSGRVTSPA